MTIWAAIRLRVQELGLVALEPRLDALEEAGADEIECVGWLSVLRTASDIVHNPWRNSLHAVPDLRLRGRLLRGWFEGAFVPHKEVVSWNFELQAYAAHDALVAASAYSTKKAK